MPSIRWGLCCQFLDSPIRFRAATHRYVATLEPAARREYLASIARDNAAALSDAVARCTELGIGAFRITSQILPLTTHPDSGYRLSDLDDDGSIARAFAEAGAAARAAGVRLSFIPTSSSCSTRNRSESSRRRSVRWMRKRRWRRSSARTC